MRLIFICDFFCISFLCVRFFLLFIEIFYILFSFVFFLFVLLCSKNAWNMTQLIWIRNIVLSDVHVMTVIYSCIFYSNVPSFIYRIFLLSSIVLIRRCRSIVCLSPLCAFKRVILVEDRRTSWRIIHRNEKKRTRKKMKKKKI